MSGSSPAGLTGSQILSYYKLQQQSYLEVVSDSLQWLTCTHVQKGWDWNISKAQEKLPDWLRQSGENELCLAIQKTFFSSLWRRHSKEDISERVRRWLSQITGFQVSCGEEKGAPLNQREKNQRWVWCSRSGLSNFFYEGSGNNYSGFCETHSLLNILRFHSPSKMWKHF